MKKKTDSQNQKKKEKEKKLKENRMMFTNLREVALRLHLLRLVHQAKREMKNEKKRN
jgi:hypothetical protein